MADSYIIVTLSTADAGSGPNYDAFYSTDCVTYAAASPATVSLPSVGSQATLVVPDNTQCIKLTNINSNCVNSVSASISITTTTTSTSTTTTSTTTTLAPTTTTTTLSEDCVCYSVLVTSEGGEESYAAAISYLPCDGGSNVERYFLTSGQYYQCARVIGGLPQINFTFGSGSITPNGSCNTGPCPPTTSTTTTTTTIAPPTTTTTTTIPPTTTTTTDSCPFLLWTHGAAIPTCSSYCTTNYLIQTQVCATGTYATLTIGDYIYGITGPGFVAYSNASTDTDTGPFKIAEIDENGQIISILECSGNTCVPL